MSVSIKDVNIIQNSDTELYNILVSLAPQLTALGLKDKDEAYTSTFSKKPVDTGESQKQTNFYTTANLRPYPLIKAVFESLQEFPFIYFAEPLQPKNPNFKYGRRNTIESARDKLAKQLGIV
jgi:hypothetical protein